MSDSAGETSKNAVMVTGSENTKAPIGLSKSASNTINDSKPRIICNELIVNPNKSKSSEKLDELSSLELEIAKMHHVDDVNMENLLSTTSPQAETNSRQVQIISDKVESDLSNGNHTSNTVQASNLEAKLDVLTSGDTALEHEDLIAVLKGLDSTTDELHANPSSEASILDEGVTIEGEGEYQIMEVVDEDSNIAADDGTKHVERNLVDQTLNKTKTFGSTMLTAQEERALALEQMEGLKHKPRRRKQEINPIKQADIALDLVSSLEADWSEHEDEVEKIKNEKMTNTNSKYNKSTALSSQIKHDNNLNSPLVTNVIVIPSTVASTTSATGFIPPMNMNIKSETDREEKRPSSNDGIIETKTEEDTEVVQSNSGFRRTRIIKRKIIWDPDAPETTFSYAKLVKSSNAKTKIKSDSVPTTTITRGSTTITPIKKETATNSVTTTTTTSKKTPRPTTPKAKKMPVDLNSEKISAVIRSDTSNVTKVKIKTEDENSKIKSDEDSIKTEKSLDTKASVSPSKKRSQTPISNGPGSGGGHKKKKNSELDRLMGDEGAVNMLNSLEKLEATLGSNETKPTRPMMRSRAATICEKIPRKETTPPARSSPSGSSSQQSNKIKRTPKSRASSTWDYVYKKKKQDFDDSLIIRRRSNSSYSSTTSQNRLSLDSQPVNTNETSTKSNNSKNLPASTSQDDLSKIPSSTSQNKNSGSSKDSSTPSYPGKSFEFAKPENKKTQKRTKSPAATLPNDMKKAAPAANRRNARSPANSNEEKDSPKPSTKSLTTTHTNSKDKKETATTSSNVVSDVVVKKSSKVAQILFSTNKAKLNNTFTMQMLNKLVDILNKLSTDSDCHVVVIGTNDTQFCQGVDISDLTTITAEKRKTYALNLATSVKNYFKTLATFPKPLIAGVCGNLVNLGVMQLALFDIVIASDKTTFETPYVKIGQVPEGFCIWNNINKIRGSFKTKLFWLCEKVQSTEAALAGLINKLTCGNKVNDEAFNTAKRIASMSSESYGVMKATVINSNLDIIENFLDEEFNTITRQWTSNECLENIKKFIEQGHF